jgi:type I restriction enzyme S subunit
MNAAQVIDHFDQICDAPDAIPRLRRFILDLAVRGTLVEQALNDEPISDEILRKGAVPKNQPIGRTGADLGPVRADEVQLSIPAIWKWGRMHQLCENGAPIVYGILQPGPNLWPNGVPYIRPSEIENGRIILRDIRHTSEEIACKYSRAAVRTGDVILTIVGTLGATAVVPPELDGGNITQSSCRLRPDARLIARDYLVMALQSTCLISQIQRLKLGTAVPRLNIAHVRALAFPLPPLAEQHRIVAKVDELMAFCDRLEAVQAERESRRDKLAAASLHRLNNGANAEEFREHARFHIHHLPRLTTRPEHIQQLRQTILNLAVRGKLVPQDPNDEPASELVKRIQVEKEQLAKTGTIKRLNPGPPIDAAEVPAEVPGSWIWTRLSDLMCGESQNGYSKRPDDALDGIPILRISAGTVRSDGTVAEEEHKLISGVTVAQQEQYLLQPGDLLACRFNGNRGFVGRLSIYLGYLGIKPIYPDKLIRLRMHCPLVLPKLIRCFSESNIVRSDIESYCATTVGNWGISAANLKLVKFPLPPLAEQHRIVAKVEELMALCDRLKAQLTATETESRRLLEAVLHAAVSGSIQIAECRHG